MMKRKVGQLTNNQITSYLSTYSFSSMIMTTKQNKTSATEMETDPLRIGFQHDGGIGYPNRLASLIPDNGWTINTIATDRG